MKLLKYLFKTLTLLMGCMVFHSCSEEWDRWEVINVEIDNSSLENIEIPYEGGSISIPFKTNSTWEISGNQDWISFNKNNGKGDATIEATIAANTAKESRNGSINIIFGNLEENNEILGSTSKTFSFMQHSEYEDMLNSLSLVIDSESRAESQYGGNPFYRKVMITYHFQYKNEEDLSNIQEASLKLRYHIKRIDRVNHNNTGIGYDENDSYIIPEDNYKSDKHQYIEEKKIGKYINDRYIEECTGIYCTPIIKLKDGKEIIGKEKYLTTYAI